MYKHPIEYIVTIARNHSAFYKKLYKDLPEKWQFHDLPIVPLEDFGDSLSPDKSEEIFTTKTPNGFVASSSATTGSPKMCAYTKSEWRALAETLGRIVYESKTLEDGDIIANLTMPGRMRTSYLAATFSQFFSPASCVDIPICGTEETDYIVNACQTLKPNTLAGLSYTLINVANYIYKNNIKLNIRKIFYGGELMYGCQKEFLEEVFPEARIVSYMYGSNEVGLVGYSDLTCNYNEHRVCNETCIVEILDKKSLKPIKQPFVEGIIAVTNLTKLTLPAIRLPIGDRGMWLEDETNGDRKFALSGRVKESTININGVVLNQKELREIFNHISSELPILRFQFQLTDQDKIILKIALSPSFTLKDSSLSKELIETSLSNKIKDFNSLIQSNSFSINFVDVEDIISTARSAKHRQVLDLRTVSK